MDQFTEEPANEHSTGGPVSQGRVIGEGRDVPPSMTPPGLADTLEAHAAERGAHFDRLLEFVTVTVEKHPTVTEVLNASRVRWKFNHDTEWRYGRAIGYTDKPSFTIEREEDGVRVTVLESFHPEPVPEDTLLSQIEQVISAYDAEHPMADPIAETELAQRLRAALGDQP